VRKVLKTVQLGFRAPEELARRLDEERKKDGVSISDFMTDALMHYINYRVDQRIALWEMSKEKQQQDEDQSRK